jgi:hypothetical protein
LVGPGNTLKNDFVDANCGAQFSRNELLSKCGNHREFSTQAGIDHFRDCAFSRRDFSMKDDDMVIEVDFLARLSKLQRHQAKSKDH